MDWNTCDYRFIQKRYQYEHSTQRQSEAKPAITQCLQLVLPEREPSPRARKTRCQLLVLKTWSIDTTITIPAARAGNVKIATKNSTRHLCQPKWTDEWSSLKPSLLLLKVRSVTLLNTLGPVAAGAEGNLDSVQNIISLHHFKGTRHQYMSPGGLERHFVERSLWQC